MSEVVSSGCTTWLYYVWGCVFGLHYLAILCPPVRFCSSVLSVTHVHVCPERLVVEVLLYLHRNRRLIRDGSPGRTPRLSHSSWALAWMGGVLVTKCPGPYVSFCPTIINISMRKRTFCATIMNVIMRNRSFCAMIMNTQGNVLSVPWLLTCEKMYLLCHGYEYARKRTFCAMIISMRGNVLSVPWLWTRKKTFFLCHDY